MKSDFDEIVGDVPMDGERERLRQVHELLVLAGPPPELPPHLQAGPTLGMTFGAGRRKVLRPMVLLAAAITIAAIFFGYAIGAHSSSPRAEKSLELTGTAFAPHAEASLQIFPEQSGNWPMTLTVADLPKLPQHAFYEVYLVRDGKPYLSCGVFTVSSRGDKPVTVSLNAPYVFQPKDSWVVTRDLPGDSGPGQIVLSPTRATT